MWTHRVGRRIAAAYRHLPRPAQARVERLYAAVLSTGVGELRDPEMSSDALAAMKALTIVVPVHNAPQETARCLRSLEKYGGEAEIIVVDDGSTDAAARRIVHEATERDRRRLRRNERGSGHSAACMSGGTLGARKVICLLNSDTVVTRHSWEGCVRCSPIIRSWPPVLISVVAGGSRLPRVRNGAGSDGPTRRFAPMRRRRGGVRGSARRVGRRGRVGGLSLALGQ